MDCIYFASLFVCFSLSNKEKSLFLTIGNHNCKIIKIGIENRIFEATYNKSFTLFKLQIESIPLTLKECSFV